MANTIPKAFFAYPSRTPTLKESIQVAVPELNKKGQVKIKTWEECNIGGKFVINTICNAINEAELFFADLTGLNANVMFELGYAIARAKRIWLILDETYTEEKKLFDELKVLSTVGYLSCCNSQDIVAGFYKDKPFTDIENTIFRPPIKPNPKLDSILYLKSRHDNQAAVNMSNLLQERFPEKIIVDAPNKPAVQSLEDYGNLVFGCNGLICHFTNPAREGAPLQIARHALICGMAHGFNKPLLMLAEGKFPSPIDYRDFLKHYDTSPQALGYLKGWLPHVEQDLKVDQEATAVPRLKVFVTYAHQDTGAQQKLKTHLAVIEREGKIKLWDDSEILPGNEWFKDVFNNLANSDILLYLVSARSLNSNNCNRELAEALRAETRVIPIILESCDWLNHQLSEYQAFPDRGNPINQWSHENDGWQNVVDGIRKVVDKMQLQVDSSSGTPEEELRAESASQQGNVLTMPGQRDKAIDRYSHAVKLDPSNADAYSSLGNAYHRKGDYDRAIEAFTKAIAIRGDFAGAYTNRGLAYQNKGDYARAIGDHYKAIEIQQDYADAYFNLGNTYHRKGDYDRAIEAFTKAIAIRGDFAAAYTNRGIAYQNKGDYDRAIGDHNKAIEIQPDYADAYFNLGNTYHRKGDFDRAIEAFTKAIAIRGDFAGAYTNRGIAYQNKGDYDRAIGDHNKAIEIQPDYADAYFNLGNTYHRKGDFDRAIEAFNRAIELNPNNADAYNNLRAAQLHRR